MKGMKYKSMGGLKVKNGRLINDRECGKTVIQELCETKKMIKTENKINIIAKGNMRADMMKGIM